MTRKRTLAFERLAFANKTAMPHTETTFEMVVESSDTRQSVVLAVSSSGTAWLFQSTSPNSDDAHGPTNETIATVAALPEECTSAGRISGAVELSVDTYHLVLCGTTVSKGSYRLLDEQRWILPAAPRLQLRLRSHPGAGGSASVSAVSFTPSADKNDTGLPVVLQPVVNGIDIGDGGLGPAQPLASAGLLDVTLAPFNADPTGATDATAALQRAIDFGRAAYLTVFFPSGTYTVNSTLLAVDPTKEFATTVGTPFCNNMHETFPATHVGRSSHCARTAPSIMQGTRVGERAVIVLAANTNLQGPVIKLHNPTNENINMNQVFSNIDIRIEDGNPLAQGIYARAAQGTSVQDVTIYAGQAAVGLVGGAGSGGSHIAVTVIGGMVGADVTSAQPSPTLTGLTLINQLKTGLLYQHPGRQTLSVVGLNVTQLPSATGPAIDVGAPFSIADSVITRASGAAGDTHSRQTAVGLRATDNLFALNVYVQGFGTVVDFGHSQITAADASAWTRLRTIGRPSGDNGPPEMMSANSSVKSPVMINGTVQPGRVVIVDKSSAAPAADLVSKHRWDDGNASSFPSFQSKELCNVKTMGAKGDYKTDDLAALQKAADSPACAAGLFFPKGYYAVSDTLQLPATATIVGVSRIYSNIVPHSSVAPYPAAGSTATWPLVRTGEGAGSSTTVYAMSFLVWHHLNSTYAVHWSSERGVWREAHTNRVDLNPGIIGPAAHYNTHLNVIENGGGKFYNFYQENWDYEGPLYRHLLVNGTDQPLYFYHANLEHSQGEANMEIRGSTAPVRIYGYKGEGNYVQVWVRDCADVLVLGYGGNASPFPFECPYPPTYARYSPSIFRVERTANFIFANLITQSQGKTPCQCGIFDTGFAGSFYMANCWRSLFEVGQVRNFSTPELVWPVMYARGSIS